MIPDAVVVPTFSRPELLWMTLERVAACPESKDLDIWICADNHHNRPPAIKEIRQVAAKFDGLRVRIIERQPHCYHGNSFNVLDAYREAVESGCERVFQVEDDVAVSPDFFGWHLRTQAAGDWFCSVGCKSPRIPPPPNAQGEYYAAKDFCSYGVCFPRATLAKIAQHSRPEYYGNMDGYIRQNFPDLGFSGRFTEQDGLIHRLLLMGDKPAAWPIRPVSQHVGWYGYNRGKGIRPTGTLEERYLQVKKTIISDEEMAKVVRDYHDLEPLRCI